MFWFGDFLEISIWSSGLLCLNSFTCYVQYSSKRISKLVTINYDTNLPFFFGLLLPVLNSSCKCLSHLIKTMFVFFFFQFKNFLPCRFLLTINMQPFYQYLQQLMVLCQSLLDWILLLQKNMHLLWFLLRVLVQSQEICNEMTNW